jgi:hypothetical protein
MAAPTAPVVPTVRLELTRLSPPPPQDGVSTNSTTSAGLREMVSSFSCPSASKQSVAYFGTSPAFEPSGVGAAGLGVGTEVGGMLSGTDFLSSPALVRSITPCVWPRLLPM